MSCTHTYDSKVPSAYEMQYIISQQFMLIYLSMHILTKFIHKQHVIHFSNNNTQNCLNLGPIENRALLGPFMVHHRIIGIPKLTTKPKDLSPGIKTKLQHSPGLPENSPKNLFRTIRKQFPKFSPDYSKTVPKIPKNSYTQSKKLGTEIYGLSRPLSQSQAIK